MAAIVDNYSLILRPIMLACIDSALHRLSNKSIQTHSIKLSRMEIAISFLFACFRAHCVLQHSGSVIGRYFGVSRQVNVTFKCLITDDVMHQFSNEVDFRKKYKRFHFFLQCTLL